MALPGGSPASVPLLKNLADARMGRARAGCGHAALWGPELQSEGEEVKQRVRLLVGVSQAHRLAWRGVNRMEMNVTTTR